MLHGACNDKGFFLMVRRAGASTHARHTLHGFPNAKRALEEPASLRRRDPDRARPANGKGPGPEEHAGGGHGRPRPASPSTAIRGIGDPRHQINSLRRWQAGQGRRRQAYTTLVFGNGGRLNATRPAVNPEDGSKPWSAPAHSGPRRPERDEHRGRQLPAGGRHQPRRPAPKRPWRRRRDAVRGQRGLEDLQGHPRGNVKVFGKVRQAAGL